MTSLPKQKLTVDEFVAWLDARGDDNRCELEAGELVAMTPGNLQHVRAMGGTYFALRSAIKKARVRCEAVLDGLGVAIGDDKCYIPDASVNCGELASGDVRFLPNRSLS